MACAALAVPFARPAQASIVERVVAVVGERPILLSPTCGTGRARSSRAFTPEGRAPGADRGERDVHDVQGALEPHDRRPARGAGRRSERRLSVSVDEVDNAVRNIAAQGKIDSKQLIAEAKHQGLTEQDYRDELRRQVLEGKLVQLRCPCGRVKGVREEDGKATYERWVKESKARRVDVRASSPSALRAPTPAVQQARAVLADDIVRRAGAGEDFCKMVDEYSVDTATNQSWRFARHVCRWRTFVKEVQVAIRGMKDGETTDPIHYALERRRGGDASSCSCGKRRRVPDVRRGEGPDDGPRVRRGDGAPAEAVWLADLRRGVYVST